VKSTPFFPLCFLALFLFSSTGMAADTPAPAAAPAPTASPIPAPPEIGAKAYILIDSNSGRVLAESNADQKLEPASLTKIMTAYVTFRELASGKLHLDDMVTVSEKAWRTEGSRMFAQVGAKIAVENLLKGMIVQSGNDASVALAEHIAGDEAVFAQMMNDHAKRLGMANTHYKNSMGLPDPEHYATARDLAVLTRAMIGEFPEYYKWHAIKEFVFNNIKQTNRNRLLWRDPTVDGVKTGHTEGAGYCLVTSAVRDGMRLIAVVLGTKSDNERANANQALLNYGFRFYETRQLYKANEKLAEARVWKGAESQVPAGLRQDFSVTFPRGQYANLKAGMEIATDNTAPIKQGDKLGVVKVMLNNEVAAQQDLVALQAVEEGGIFRRLFDQALMMFKK
jgi:D-alanyl-D-alanine carboxypeptidase (penicillin-binding protein 5/6)